jgi:hypothetical protein
MGSVFLEVDRNVLMLCPTHDDVRGCRMLQGITGNRPSGSDPLRVACCVLRVACCVLRVACCVLRVAC